MNKWMKTLYSGFHDIGVIGDVICKWGEMNVLPTVRREHIVQINPWDYITSLTENHSVELLIIDLDTFGVDRTGFLIFLTSCFRPQTPLVLVTEKTLSAAEHSMLHTGRVLGIIEMRSSLNQPQLACA